METQNQNPGPAPMGSPLAPQPDVVMGILSYLWVLVLIPLLTKSKSDPFVKFHAKQGLILFICEIILWVLASSLWSLMMIFNLVGLALLVLVVLGIVNVTSGEMKELPIVGQFAKYFKF